MQLEIAWPEHYDSNEALVQELINTHAWPTLKADMELGGWTQIERRGAIIIPGVDEDASTIATAKDATAIIQTTGVVGLSKNPTILTFAVNLTLDSGEWTVTEIGAP